MSNAINNTVIDVDETPEPLPAQEPETKYPGFQLWGFRVTYIPTDHPSGWCHHEGDVIARSLFSISTLHDPIPGKGGGLVKQTGVRIVVGRHSIWIMA